MTNLALWWKKEPFLPGHNWFHRQIVFAFSTTAVTLFRVHFWCKSFILPQSIQLKSNELVCEYSQMSIYLVK